jgi:4-amino-4-deoxy-L-arabinose transferase-like glycosyltransferase
MRHARAILYTAPMRQTCGTRTTSYVRPEPRKESDLRRRLDTSLALTAIALGIILLLTFWVRIGGIAWDGYASLHPDERHLFFVSAAMFTALADPAHASLTVSDWLFSDQSPLTPHTGTASYVYGEAPLLVGVALGQVLGATDWFAFMPVARSLSVLVDLTTVLTVFLGGRLLAGNAAGLAAAVLYAAMPSAIQLSHFHTVDVWLSAATSAALVAMLALALDRCGKLGRTGMTLLLGAIIGLAMASKITGVLLLGPAAVTLALLWHKGSTKTHLAFLGALMLVAVAVVFRITNPFAFEGPGIFGLSLSPDWIDDFIGLAEVTASPHFPPNWQWIAGYGPWRLARDMVLFGTGPVVMAILIGLRVRDWKRVLIIPLSVIIAFVLLMGFSSVAALRYGTPALPAFAMLAAPVITRLNTALVIAVLALSVYWGSGAVRLHDGDHPRLLASRWLWALPRGTIITNETGWDEHLPTILSLAKGAPHRWPSHDNWFTFQVLDITDPDTVEKADRIAALLAQTDVLVLSSDRHSAVMPRLPDRFPMTTVHYDTLLSGQACFAPVLVLDRGYPLPFLSLDDSWAQEPWRVYDHPIVRIYLREPCFSEERYRALLRTALAR